MPNNQNGEATTMKDVTGISGTGNVAEGSRLIAQFGLLTVFAAALLAACGMLLWFVLFTARNDAIQVFQNLRDDWHEDRMESRRDQEKHREAIRELSKRTLDLHSEIAEGNRNTSKAIEVATKQLAEIRKLTSPPTP